MGDKIRKGAKTRAVAQVRADLVDNKNFNNIGATFALPPQPLKTQDLVKRLGFEILCALVEHGGTKEHFVVLLTNNFTQNQLEEILVKNHFAIFKKALIHKRYDVLRSMFKYLGAENKLNVVLLNNFQFIRLLSKHGKLNVVKRWFSFLDDDVKKELVTRRNCGLFRAACDADDLDLVAFVLEVVESLGMTQEFLLSDEYKAIGKAFTYNSPKSLGYIARTYPTEVDAWLQGITDDQRRGFIVDDDGAFFEMICEEDEAELVTLVLSMADSLDIEENFLLGDVFALDKALKFNNPKVIRIVIGRLLHLHRLQDALDEDDYRHLVLVAADGFTEIYKMLFAHLAGFLVSGEALAGQNYQAFRNACENDHEELVRFMIQEAKKLDGTGEKLAEMLSAEDFLAMNLIATNNCIKVLKVIEEEIADPTLLRDFVCNDNFFDFRAAHAFDAKEVAGLLFNKFLEYGCIDEAIASDNYMIVGTEEGVENKPNNTHNHLVCEIYRKLPGTRGGHLIEINRHFGDTLKMRLNNAAMRVVKRDPEYCLGKTNWLVRFLASSTRVGVERALTTGDFRAHYNLTSLGDFRVTPERLMMYKDVAQKLASHSTAEYALFKSGIFPRSIVNRILGMLIGIEVDDAEYKPTPEFVALVNITRMKETQKSHVSNFSTRVKGNKTLNFVDRLNAHLLEGRPSIAK